MNAKFLANIMDWFSDVFEHMSPALFRMLSTILPYLTPLPVAYITAHSATSFLGLEPWVSGILVFTLEGIGVWVTSELVDSFVDAIRSKNVRAWGVVIFLFVVVAAYVALLITLNVILDNAGAARSIVLTIICFLPLISGSLNGYRKTKLEIRTNMELQKRHQEQLNAELRTLEANERMSQAERETNERLERERLLANERIETARLRSQERLEKAKIQPTNERIPANTERTNVRKRTNAPTNERSTNGDLRTFVIQLIDEYERTNRSVAGVSEISKQIAMSKNGSNSIDGYERYKGYVSEVRKQWLQEHPNYLQ